MRAFAFTRGVTQCILARPCSRAGLAPRKPAVATRGLSAARGTTAVVCAASKKEIISTDAAPGAVGPYSQAIKTGGFLYVSGCIPLVPGTKDFNSDKVDEQADQALKNMGEILKAGGCSYGDVVKTTVLLASIDDFAAVNGVYAKYFPNDPPARSAFAVKELPLGAKVEIECIAAC
eukprot:CAMPEP_0197489800 /NCGR_PEP_ID=MMETSP1311-20131121/4509_1 /TAXON_ID=464262 /ORGANISM="Genus nov. species nov., Strain RCC856" /LENGTH=175 /DNA_ID=CAMNT_0043034193 /DNA_START=69 /DNA_END=596 /DNA_ORIENTATION=+